MVHTPHTIPDLLQRFCNDYFIQNNEFIDQAIRQELGSGRDARKIKLFLDTTDRTSKPPKIDDLPDDLVIAILLREFAMKIVKYLY